MTDNITSSRDIIFKTECSNCERKLKRSIPTNGKHSTQNGIMIGCTKCGQINFTRDER